MLPMMASCSSRRRRPASALRCRRTAVAGALAATITLAACGSSDAADGRPLDVAASFYPLAFVTGRVGGERVKVANLTPPGVEPHDVELTARDTARIADADLVVTLGGFAGAVDDAVANEASDHSIDVGSSARLDLEHAPLEGDEGSGSRPDPHFWLDPTRLADVADAVAAELGRLLPEGEGEFTANAAALRVELERLDGEFAAGLEQCSTPISSPATTPSATSPIATG